MLRERGKSHAAGVTRWLEPRLERVSGVTIREAVKYLDEADRARLMAAYSPQRA